MLIICLFCRWFIWNDGMIAIASILFWKNYRNVYIYICICVYVEMYEILVILILTIYLLYRWFIWNTFGIYLDTWNCILCNCISWYSYEKITLMELVNRAWTYSLTFKMKNIIGVLLISILTLLLLFIAKKYK